MGAKGSRLGGPGGGTAGGGAGADLEALCKAYEEVHQTNYAGDGRKCLQLLERRFEELIKAKEGREALLSLSQAPLLEILKRDTLAVSNEFSLFLLVGAWAHRRAVKRLEELERKREEDRRKQRTVRIASKTAVLSIKSEQKGGEEAAKNEEKQGEDKKGQQQPPQEADQTNNLAVDKPKIDLRGSAALFQQLSHGVSKLLDAFEEVYSDEEEMGDDEDDEDDEYGEEAILKKLAAMEKEEEAEKRKQEQEEDDAADAEELEKEEAELAQRFGQRKMNLRGTAGLFAQMKAGVSKDTETKQTSGSTAKTAARKDKGKEKVDVTTKDSAAKEKEKETETEKDGEESEDDDEGEDARAKYERAVAEQKRKQEEEWEEKKKQLAEKLERDREQEEMKNKINARAARSDSSDSESSDYSSESESDSDYSTKNAAPKQAVKEEEEKPIDPAIEKWLSDPDYLPLLREYMLPFLEHIRFGMMTQPQLSLIDSIADFVPQELLTEAFRYRALMNDPQRHKKLISLNEPRLRSRMYGAVKWNSRWHNKRVTINPSLLIATQQHYVYSLAVGSPGFSSGVHAWSVKVEAQEMYVGVCRRGAKSNRYLGTDKYGWGWNQYSYRYHNNYRTGQTGPYGSNYVSGDSIGVLLDMDKRQLTFFLNGTSQGVAFSNLPKTKLYPAVTFRYGNMTLGPPDFDF
ncbi:E3 ubiquitin-protein ligase trim9 [Balamuthia mandrillaris]